MLRSSHWQKNIWRTISPTCNLDCIRRTGSSPPAPPTLICCTTFWKLSTKRIPSLQGKSGERPDVSSVALSLMSPRILDINFLHSSIDQAMGKNSTKTAGHCEQLKGLWATQRWMQTFEGGNSFNTSRHRIFYLHRGSWHEDEEIEGGVKTNVLV